MIRSERLTIRPMEEADLEFIVEILNEPDFIQNIGDKAVRNIEDARRYMLEGPQACHQEHGFSLMTVSLHDGTAVGLSGLLKREHFEFPDLGYAFLSRFYRQGYAYEAAIAVLNHYQHLRPLYAITSEDNEPSQALLLKLKFNQLEQSEEDKAQQTQMFLLN